MAPEDDLPFTDVCATSEIPPGRAVAVRAAGRDFLLCHAEGRYYAVAERCTHAAWSLAGGEVRGCELACSLHGARFDLRTGDATRPPASKPLRTFPVRTRGGRIQVQVTPLPR